ncbi:MAG: hypothetical protein GOMPHAMPRED_004171 [Gomphillus americanus]|uniref:Uncharacterized protein n=1 Tax=Gomphillus americanus TaxID=1940652 RepID=A0A8H3IU33_9LECA|nr:MAG: hypothetical protein GOMPHAMPRED_004171 [Gomphillus americanus]
MGNGKGIGVAMLIGKKRDVNSDDSDSSEHRTDLQVSKKSKSDGALSLDFLGSGSESDGDFDPTVKALYEANAKKTKESMGRDPIHSYVLSYEQNEADTESVSKEKGLVVKVADKKRKRQIEAPSRIKTSSKDNGPAVGIEKAVLGNQKRCRVQSKNDKQLKEVHLQKPKTRSKGKTFPRK